MISYSQNFEDVMLVRALLHVKEGFYVDIGAQDPLIDSVRQVFYDMGWQGIHVEPTQVYADKLRQSRQGDVVIQAVVADTEGMVSFYEIPETGISSADPLIAASHSEKGFVTTEIKVPSVSLSSIFDLCPSEVHWLKIDVEGFEESVLRSWGTSAVRPWILIVESTLPLSQTENYEKWDHLVVERGYEMVYFDGLNRFYVSILHPELSKAFRSPPNVFDGFALSGMQSPDYGRVIADAYEKRLLIQRQEADAELFAQVSKVSALSNSFSQLEADMKRVEQEAFDLRASLQDAERKSGARELELLRDIDKARLDIEEQLRVQVRREQEVYEEAMMRQGEWAAERAGLEGARSEIASRLADAERRYAIQLEALGAENKLLEAELKRLCEDFNVLQNDNENLKQQQKTQSNDYKDAVAAFFREAEWLRKVIDEAAKRESEIRSERIQFEILSAKHTESVEWAWASRLAESEAKSAEISGELARESQEWARKEALLSVQSVELQQKNSELVSEIAAIRQSRSWRLTAPLRSLKIMTLKFR